MVNIHNLCFSYQKKAVFNELNIVFQQNSIQGILGRNGSGKSTLFKIISGLIFAKSGTINVLGHSPAKRLPSMLKEIFLLPEDFFVPPVTIDELASTMAPFYDHFNENDFKKYLQMFEVEKGKKLTDMSMGQKKKALIAFSLATNVKLLMLDEPTNGLDIDSKIQFKYLMTQLSTPDRCILISTHQVKDIENIVDRITVIEDGKLLFQESMENIAQKLCFRYNASLNDNEVVLFSEELLNGKATVTLNQNQEETMVDLELLYKALIHQPASISKIFAHE